MDAVVTAITGSVTPTAIWGQLAMVAVFVGSMILVSLGIHFLRRTVSGASKAKAKF